MMSGWEPMNFVGNNIATNANFDGNYMNLNGILLAPENVSFAKGGESNNAFRMTPKWQVSLQGGYKLNGTVVSSEFEMSNGASFTYKKIDTSNFWNSGSSQGDTGTGDLIITSPIIEPN